MPGLGPGSSRTMSLLLKCAVLVRDKLKCIWCLEDLTYEAHTIDHIDNNHGNNSPMNLLSACASCNSARMHGDESFEAYLIERKIDPERAVTRANRHRCMPIDRRSEKTRALATQWYGARIEYLNRTGSDRSKRSREHRSAITSIVLGRGSEEDMRLAMRGGYIDTSGAFTDTGQRMADLIEVPF